MTFVVLHIFRIKEANNLPHFNLHFLKEKHWQWLSIWPHTLSHNFQSYFPHARVFWYILSIYCIVLFVAQQSTVHHCNYKDKNFLPKPMSLPLFFFQLSRIYCWRVLHCVGKSIRKYDYYKHKWVLIIEKYITTMYIKWTEIR